jgi:hypothetical protein
MSGNHSSGEAAGHALVPIETAAGITDEIDAEMRLRRREIARQLRIAEGGLADVIAAAEAISAEIRAIADAAVQKVNAAVADRALLLRSARTELQRKQAELDALTSLFVTTRDNAGPVAFLRKYAIVRSCETDDLPLVAPGTLPCLTGVLDVAETDRPAGRWSAVDSPRTQSPDLLDDCIAAISLESLSRRKEAKYRNRGVEMNAVPFDKSAILTKQQAITLYLCFPFHGQPKTRLLFSSARDGRSIRKCHEMVDHVGITAVIVKAGAAIVGGFAASKWKSDGRPFGNGKNTFLFNITNDALIPYRPRTEDACHLFATEECLAFGRRDLVIAGDFEKCSSALENSYGVGFLPESEEAKTFLVGTHEFVADLVEVWGFFIVHTHVE